MIKMPKLNRFQKRKVRHSFNDWLREHKRTSVFPKKESITKANAK